MGPREHRLERIHHLEARRDEVFAFFADPRNLETLTPPSMSLRVVDAPARLAEGARVSYRVRIRGVPVTWVGEIAEWDPPRGFVDVQLRGPYASWRHEHAFEPTQDGGTLVRDRVTYSHRGGTLVERLVVRPELERLWAWRRKALAERFGV